MDQREHPEERQLDLYVLPVVSSAIIGYIIADWLGVNGVLGIIIGAFVVDAFRGLRGTHRLVEETEDLAGLVRRIWEKRKSQRFTQEDAPDIKDSSQPPLDEEPADGEIYPSA
jgi:hypothetical protein